MIEELHIRNFQSHKKTKLKFSSGVNMIVGASDTGKSAIIRALNWLVNNRPLGDDICSLWGGTTSVVAKLKQDYPRSSIYVHRLKNNKNNLYKIKLDWMGTIETYDKVGTQVPDEVSKVINIDSINLQQQLDGPFLLNLSSGAVAQHFNKVAHLEKLDVGVEHLKRQIRKTESKKNNALEQIASIKEELKKYDNLEQIEGELKVVEFLEQKKNKVSRELKGCKKVMKTITAYQSELQKYRGKDFDKIERRLDRNLEALSKLHDHIEEQNKLRKLYKKLSQLTQEMDEQKRKAKQMKQLFQRMFPRTCPLCGQKVSASLRKRIVE